MKKYTDSDPLHGNGKSTPKPTGPIGSWMPEWRPMSAKTFREDYTHDGTKLIRRHLPLNRRPSRRALKRNAAAILAK